MTLEHLPVYSCFCALLLTMLLQRPIGLCKVRFLYLPIRTAKPSRGIDQPVNTQEVVSRNLRSQHGGTGTYVERLAIAGEEHIWSMVS